MPEEGSITVNPFSLGSVRRRLLSGSAWVMGAKVATLIVGLGAQAVLTRLLTRTEYGIYAQAFTLALVGAAIAQMGLDRAVVRFVAEALGFAELGKAGIAIRTALTYGTLGALAVGLLLSVGPHVPLVGHVFREGALDAVIPITAGWLIALAVQSLMVESFRGMSRFAAATLLDEFFVDLITLCVFTAMWVAVGHPGKLSKKTPVGHLGVHGPEIVIAVSAAAVALVVAVGLLLLLRRYRMLRGPGELPRREMLHVAWPLGVTNVGTLLLGTGVDVLVVGLFVMQRTGTVGVYAASSKLVIFVATPFVVFSGVIPPLIAELHAQHKTRPLERALRAGATLAGLPAFGVLLVFLLFGPWVLGHVFGLPYAVGAPILAILSIGRLYAIWTGSAGVTLMMTGYQKPMMWLTIVCGVLSIVFGISAAAITKAAGFSSLDIAIAVACATVAAQILQNTLQLILVRRWLGIWTMIHFSPRQLYRYLRPKGRGTAAEAAATTVAEAFVGPDDPQDGP